MRAVSDRVGLGLKQRLRCEQLAGLDGARLSCREEKELVGDLRRVLSEDDGDSGLAIGRRRQGASNSKCHGGLLPYIRHETVKVRSMHKQACALP